MARKKADKPEKRKLGGTKKRMAWRDYISKKKPDKDDPTKEVVDYTGMFDTFLSTMMYIHTYTCSLRFLHEL